MGHMADCGIAGGDGAAAVPCHHRQQGREDPDHAGGRHVRVHCPCPAALLQGNHFPGGEGKWLGCVVVLNLVLRGC